MELSSKYKEYTMRHKTIHECILDYLYVIIFEMGVLVISLIRLA